MKNKQKNTKKQIKEMCNNISEKKDNEHNVILDIKMKEMEEKKFKKLNLILQINEKQKQELI